MQEKNTEDVEKSGSKKKEKERRGKARAHRTAAWPFFLFQ